MKKNSFLTRLIINAIAIYFTAEIVKGVDITGFGAAVVASFILGIVNTIIKPILVVFTLPINIFTLGLFTFVINGIALMIVSDVTKGFYISSIGSAVVASIIISIISSILNAFTD